MKKLLVLAAIAILLPSMALAGWAKHKGTAPCKCVCHKHAHKDKDGVSAKACGDINRLNNDEQKSKPEKSK